MRLSLTLLSLCLVASLAACAHSEPSGAVGIERWAENHPEASAELGQWVQNHKEAARLFFEWDAGHWEKSHEFVTWAIRHHGEPIEAFIAHHPGWPVFATIMESHRPAAEAFIHWCRRHPRAAETLMNHPHGLEWAGHHLYASYWEMEAK